MAGSKQPLIAVFIHPAKIRTQLENVTLHDGWQQIPGFLILRTTLHGPGWSLVTLYPYGNLHNRILKIILQQIPFTLTALVLMTSAFLLVTTSLTGQTVMAFCRCH